MKGQIINSILILCVLFLSCENNTNNTDKISDLSEKAKSTIDDTKNSVSSNLEKIAPSKVKPAQGIDISNFQGNEIDFLSQQKDNLTFVICKATEGITYTDPKFAQNWASIPKAGFIRGAYHFYRSADKPEPQAENFSRAISDLSKTNIAPIVDFEGGGIDQSQSVETVQSNLLVFLQKIEAATNRKPIIYTNPSTGNKYLNSDDFSQYALWLADYSKAKIPTLPEAWKNETWFFWQKTSDYVIDNQKNDFDIFNGDKAALINFIETY